MLELKDRPASVLDENGETKGEYRLTLRLSPEAREALEWIANQRQGVSYAEVIRRALGTERFLLEKMNEGASILIEEPKSKRLREIILR